MFRRYIGHRAPVAAFLGAGRIREDHDGCLEALRSVHRHHAHAGTRVGEFALDRDFARSDLGKEPDERGLLMLLVRQREFEELADDVIDLRAKPCAELAQASITIEYVTVEIVGALEVEPIAPIAELIVGDADGQEF